MLVAKPEINWILDITIAYPQGKPLDLPTIITGSRPPCETVLFYRVFPSSVVSFKTFDWQSFLFSVGIFYYIIDFRFHENQNYYLNGYMIGGSKKKHFWKIFTSMEHFLARKHLPMKVPRSIRIH